MTRSVSFALDILRIAAALAVFLHHCAQFWNGPLYAATDTLAHQAVIVFFVLSGYVIAVSANTKNRGLKEYAFARLSRLLSVTIPALLLTAVLLVVGAHRNGPFYADLSRGHEGLRICLAALFLQSNWFLGASPPTDAPFWSLGYEFWYYVLFGIAFFLPRSRNQAALIVAAALIMGPNILLLLPCWLAGAAIYLVSKRWTLSTNQARVGLLLTTLLYLTIVWRMPPLPYPLGHPPLWFSSQFLTDWLIAGALAGAIACFAACGVGAPSESGLKRTRWIADHTFSFYLYHFPIIAFVTAMLRLTQLSPVQMLAYGAGVMVIVGVLGFLTERKRSVWRAALERVYRKTRARTA